MVLFNEDCVKCMECEELCPAECIELRKDGAYKDYEKCLDERENRCGLCLEVCPVLL